MARRMRIEFRGAIDHVTVGMLGDWRKEPNRLFADDKDRLRFIDQLGEGVDHFLRAIVRGFGRVRHMHLTPRMQTLLGGCLTGLLCFPSSVRAAAIGGDVFFEKEIRPLLIEHCHDCHSADASKLKGGLYLDHKEGWVQGGDSGPAIVPGDPEASLVIKAVRYQDNDLAMPPKYRLQEADIAKLEEWIRLGAPDPRSKPVHVTRKQTGLTLEEGRAFWSYRPLARPDPPPLKEGDWAWNFVDQHIASVLKQHGLKPVADADRVTLIRRVSFDLTGLPPTPEAIEAFRGDTSPDAYERLIDHLLDSPQFGERWGRYWLDVARFAESVTLRGFVFEQAWRYRDYVIESFNRDVPYDQFVREQLAGDLMPDGSLAERQRRRIATTFLTLGNANLEDQDKSNLEMDVVDEQLEVIGRAFLAQTIGCARCHDHKFDPIPTRDYYAMAGILKSTRMLDHANVSTWVEVPLPLSQEEEARFAEINADLKRVEADIKHIKNQLALLKEPFANPTPDRPAVLPAKAFPGVTLDDQEARPVGRWVDSTYTKRYIGSGYRHDDNKDKGAKTLTFEPAGLKPGRYEVRFAYTHGDNRAPAAPVTVFSADGEKTVLVNETQPPPIEGRFVSLGQYLFEKDGQAYVMVSNKDTTGHVIADAVQFLPADEVPAVARQETPEPSQASPPSERESSRTKEIKGLEAQAATLAARQKELKTLGARRPRVMSVLEESPGDIPIRIRGEVHKHGPVAPRGVLSVTLRGEIPVIPENQSGRLQVADWIASADNPLTARVMVNRIWGHLFGSGLVRTMDNFGTTGETPSHPELLDDLAARFLREGWSVKRLIRHIMLSHTYQLSTDTAPESMARDPDNRWWWRMNRRRLDAESIRDAMLFVAGRLELELGGSTIPKGISADYGQHYEGWRRSVYVPVFRNSLPELFEVFDFADSSVPVGRRNVSTVAPQALYLMNHPFVMDQAAAAARRTLAESGLDWRHRLERAVVRTLGRPPTDRETELARAFFGPAGEDGEVSEKRWAQYYQVLFSSIDFRYLD